MTNGRHRCNICFDTGTEPIIGVGGVWVFEPCPTCSTSPSGIAGRLRVSAGTLEAVGEADAARLMREAADCLLRLVDADRVPV